MELRGPTFNSLCGNCFCKFWPIFVFLVKPIFKCEVIKHELSNLSSIDIDVDIVAYCVKGQPYVKGHYDCFLLGIQILLYLELVVTSLGLLSI